MRNPPPQKKFKRNKKRRKTTTKKTEDKLKQRKLEMSMKTSEAVQAWQDSGVGSMCWEKRCSCEEDFHASWCQVPPNSWMHGSDSHSVKHKDRLRISERSLLWVVRHSVNYLKVFLLVSIHPLTTLYEQRGRVGLAEGGSLGPGLRFWFVWPQMDQNTHIHTYNKRLPLFHLQEYKHIWILHNIWFLKVISVKALLVTVLPSGPDSLGQTVLWKVDNRKSGLNKLQQVNRKVAAETWETFPSLWESLCCFLLNCDLFHFKMLQENLFFCHLNPEILPVSKSTNSNYLLHLRY